MKKIQTESGWITQKELAERVGVTRQCVNNWISRGLMEVKYFDNVRKKMVNVQSFNNANIRTYLTKSRKVNSNYEN